jgi:hypothetical protein
VNGSCGQSEQSVILALAYVLSRVKVCSTLTNKDLACVNFLARVTLYAKTLCIGVSTVSGGANAFFGCHLF